MQRIRKEDFMIRWANHVKSGMSPATMQKCLTGLIKLILEELELNGEIWIPDLGRIEIVQNNYGDKVMDNPIIGGRKIVNVKPKFLIRFHSSMVFERAINEDSFNFVPRSTGRKRRYTPSEHIQMRNEARRKPKQTKEDLLCDLLNKKERKVKDIGNGET